MSLYNNCLGSTSGCLNGLHNPLFQPELIPDPILWMIAHTPHSVGSGISNHEVRTGLRK